MRGGGGVYFRRPARRAACLVGAALVVGLGVQHSGAQVPMERVAAIAAADGTGTAAVAPAAPALVAAGVSTDAAAEYPLGTVSLSQGRLYLAFLTLTETGGAVDTTPGVVGAGTWTKVDAGQASARNMGMTAYWMVPDADIASADLRTDTLSTVHEGIHVSVVEVASGFSPSEPVEQYSAGRAGAATGYTRTLAAAPAADSLVLGAFAHAANEGSTPDPEWTELAGSDLGHGAPSRAAHVVYDETTPGPTAGSTWATSSPRRGIVVEIPSGAPVIENGVTVVAAGDICGGCGNTSTRVREVAPDAVITIGDLAYTNGLLSEFQQKYGGGTTPATNWGRPSIKDVTLPGYGNHDCYDVPRDTGATKQGCDDAVTYFGADSQFGIDIPGTPGSYFTTVGQWLVVHLNSAGDVGSGQATAEEVAVQNAALDAILTEDTHACEVVVWHHPRYSSGEHRNNTFVDPWYDTAYAHGVDVVLNGHDHDYERFARQDGDGNAIPDGIVQFVVGTGGIAPRPFGTVEPNSLVRIVDKGILAMELRDDATYSWEFLDDLTGAVDDAGSGTCRP